MDYVSCNNSFSMIYTKSNTGTIPLHQGLVRCPVHCKTHAQTYDGKGVAPPEQSLKRST